MPAKKPRILISKLGLDGHDRGAKLIAHTLREAGIDVIYLGIRHTVDEVVDTAVGEQVDFVGLSFLAGDHMAQIPKVIEQFRSRGTHDVRIIVGGIIARREIPELKVMGVEEVFLPGTPLDNIVAYITEHSDSQE